MSTKPNPDELFDKVRRNLVLISVFLIFFQYAGAEIQSINVGSTARVVINHPDAVLHLAWLAWLYMYIRAWQFYNTHLKNRYKKEVQNVAAPILHPYLEGLDVPEEKETYFFETLERFHLYDIKFQPLFKPPLYCRYSPKNRAKPKLTRSKNRSFGGVNLINYRFERKFKFALDWWPWRIYVWSISEGKTGNHSMEGIKTDIYSQMGVRFLRGIKIKAKIYKNIVLSTSGFMEYRVPFIIGLVPVPYYLLARL